MHFQESLPHLDTLLWLGLRLLVAALVGGVLGFDRQRRGKFAGLRTHILVSLGTATFVVATLAVGGTTEDTARVVQGVAAGIGFIGAGSILKVSQTEHVYGLTTASSIWMTAALGAAAGLGAIWIAATAAIVAWLVLALLARYEPHAPSESP